MSITMTTNNHHIQLFIAKEIIGFLIVLHIWIINLAVLSLFSRATSRCGSSLEKGMKFERRVWQDEGEVETGGTESIAYNAYVVDFARHLEDFCYNGRGRHWNEKGGLFFMSTTESRGKDGLSMEEMLDARG